MSRRTLRRRAALAALAAGAVLALAPSALATFPGENGLIAFSRGGDIWTIHPDGTGEKQLTFGPEHTDVAPEWSPDGKEIFFQRTGNDGAHIYRMKPDGTEFSWVRAGAFPQLSGDGTQLAFFESGGTPNVSFANRDGSNPKLLDSDDNLVSVDDWAPTHSLILATFRDGDALFSAKSPTESTLGWKLHDDDLHFSNDDPAWSPDGTKIAFATFPVGISSICFGEPTCPDPTVGIRTMNLGGGDLKTVRHGIARSPVWSPDASLIAYVDGSFATPMITIMESNGAGRRPLASGEDPDWQAVAPAPPPPPPPPPEPTAVTVTVPVQVPGPERVVEKTVTKVVTKVVTTDGKVCPIPAAKRKLALTIRTTRAIKKGVTVKVWLDLESGRANVSVPKNRPLRVVAR